MDNLNLSIQKLRFNSFFLFWLPVIALLGTLFVHNFFIEFKYSPAAYKFNNTNVKEVFCNEENNYCNNLDLLIPNLNKKNLNLCEKNYYYVNQLTPNNKIYTDVKKIWIICYEPLVGYNCELKDIKKNEWILLDSKNFYQINAKLYKN